MQTEQTHLSDVPSSSPGMRNVSRVRQCLGVFGLCLVLAGCPKPKPADDAVTTALPYAGTQLRLVVPASLDLAEKWAPAINDWADENAAVVDVVEMSADDGPDQWLALLSQPPTSLVLLPTPRLGELVGEKLVGPIPAETIAADVVGWHQIPAGLRSALDMLEDSPAFVTLTSPVPVIAIRSDLLEAAGRQSPTTWAEYDRLVTELPQWGPEHTAVEPRRDEDLSTLLFARAISGTKHPAQLSVELDVSSGDPLIGASPFIRALSEMQAISPHLADNVRSMSPADCQQALTNGTAAMGIVWRSDDQTADALTTADPSTSLKNPGTLAYFPLPGRNEVYDRDHGEWTSPPDGDVNQPALCGFGGLTVCVTTVGTKMEQSAAWDLWGLLTAYQLEGTIPSLPDNLSELSKAETSSAPYEVRTVMTVSLQNPMMVCELPMYGRDEMRRSLTTAVRRSLDESVDAESALQQAQTEWTNIIDELGRTKVLNSYRLRLGLVPVPE